MIYAGVEVNTPVILVPGAGEEAVEVYVGKQQTHHIVKDAGLITLPFLDHFAFRGTDVSAVRRVQMERSLLRTGLFSSVLIAPGAPGWLPIEFTLFYNNKSYKGWLYYDNPYD